MTDKEKILKLKELDYSRYKDVSLDYLIMYVVSLIDKQNINLSFENIVAAAFQIFPQKFQLLGYTEYPDAKRVHDCLFRCTFKTKQWLGGKTRQGFKITERSKIFIAESEKYLFGEVKKLPHSNSKTRRKEHVLIEIEKSNAFQKFISGNKSNITEGDICILLQGTLDTPKDILKTNLKTLKSFASELQHKEITHFLDWLHDNFNYFLS
ncbi:hypothetical protein JXQ31_14100 [candidate division KSB1 bacterium]|nr:hypothetical protein [candidate division KSB1 bacterium]